MWTVQLFFISFSFLSKWHIRKSWKQIGNAETFTTVSRKPFYAEQARAACSPALQPSLASGRAFVCYFLFTQRVRVTSPWTASAPIRKTKCAHARKYSPPAAGCFISQKRHNDYIVKLLIKIITCFDFLRSHWDGTELLFLFVTSVVIYFYLQQWWVSSVLSLKAEFHR